MPGIPDKIGTAYQCGGSADIPIGAPFLLQELEMPQPLF